MPILECVCSALKVITFVMSGKKHPYKLFEKYLEKDDVQQLKNNFTRSLESVLKLKQNMSAFLIMQFVILHQESSKMIILPPFHVSNVR